MVHVPEFKYSKNLSCLGFDFNSTYNTDNLVILDIYKIGLNSFTEGDLIYTKHNLGIKLINRYEKAGISELYFINFKENELVIRQSSSIKLNELCAFTIAMLTQIKKYNDIQNKGLETKIKEVVKLRKLLKNISVDNRVKKLLKNISVDDRVNSTIKVSTNGGGWQAEILPFIKKLDSEDFFGVEKNGMEISDSYLSFAASCGVLNPNRE